MKILLKPFNAKGEIQIIPSKSYAHRHLICSAFCGGKTILKNVGKSQDVLATIDCLKQLGAKIDLVDNDAVVFGIEKPPKTATLDCGESGSTLRFLMPVCSALGVSATFTGRGKLLSRPNDKLISVLIEHGVLVKGLTHSGKLSGGKFLIDASVSSQYITGLLIASVLTGEDCEIELLNKAVSKSYILITLSVLKEYGINVEFQDNKLKIKGEQTFVSPKEVTVEGDWSSAAFPLVLGAINGGVSVSGLNIDSVQGDKVILEALKKAGCKFDISDDKITIEKSVINAFEFDIEDCPDTAPIISTLMSFALGKSVIKNVERLKIKESNRLEAIIDNLRRANIKTEYKDNSLYIFGGNPIAGDFEGYNDHRIVMSAVILSSALKGDSMVNDYQAVNKSYPNFYEDLIKLGGQKYVEV